VAWVDTSVKPLFARDVSWSWLGSQEVDAQQANRPLTRLYGLPTSSLSHLDSLIAMTMRSRVSNPLVDLIVTADTCDILERATQRLGPCLRPLCTECATGTTTSVSTPMLR